LHKAKQNGFMVEELHFAMQRAPNNNAHGFSVRCCNLKQKTRKKLGTDFLKTQFFSMKSGRKFWNLGGGWR
jgi:hypothetical protein